MSCLHFFFESIFFFLAFASIPSAVLHPERFLVGREVASHRFLEHLGVPVLLLSLNVVYIMCSYGVVLYVMLRELLGFRFPDSLLSHSQTTTNSIQNDRGIILYIAGSSLDAVDS